MKEFSEEELAKNNGKNGAQFLLRIMEKYMMCQKAPVGKMEIMKICMMQEKI